MNKRVRHLFVAITDNRVIHASTSLSEFHRTIKGLITDINSLSYYQKKFADQEIINHTDHLGKTYSFQKFK